MSGRVVPDEAVIRPSIDGSGEQELLTAPRFYWGCCMVCRKAGTQGNPLKRCAGCASIFYCSKDHQRLHWKQHKRMCQYLTAAAEGVGAKTFFGKEFQEFPDEDPDEEADEEGRDDEELAQELSAVDLDDAVVPDEAVDMEGGDKAALWKSWTKFRVNAVQMAQVLLGGIRLQEWEKEMFLFPKACRVCRIADLEMFDCHKCQGTTYCSSDHRDQDTDRHAEICPELKYAMEMDNYESTVSIAAPPVPSTIDSSFRPEKYRTGDIKSYLIDQVGWSRTSSLYPNAKKNKKKSKASDDPTEVDLDEMEFRFLSDRLSGPLTIAHVCTSLVDQMANGVEVGACRDLTVHIVGASIAEMLGIIKWEYLTHRLPALENCRIVFVGPELGDQGEDENGECSGIGECQDCAEAGRSLVYEVRPVPYHVYVEQGTAAGYYTVPDVVCAFNCGFHEFQNAPDKEEWGPSLRQLVEHPLVPLLFTSYTQNEAGMDLRSFKSRFTEDELEKKLKFDAVGLKNPFRSHRPVRDFECDDNRDIFYSNQYLTVVRRVQE